VDVGRIIGERTVADVTLEQLALRLREFAAVRDWDQFHTPKNLAMALAGEVGELLAELQWLTPQEAARVMADPEAAARVRSELADVTIYLVRLADLLDVDLIEAAQAKLDEGERRYNVADYRGSARKAPPLSSKPPSAPVVRRAVAVRVSPGATYRS
jgi:NTP pyrophosphatase (non-canonical NTP hydrolase)